MKVTANTSNLGTLVLTSSLRCCVRHAMVKDAESSNALACIIVPLGVITKTWQIMRST